MSTSIRTSATFFRGSGASPFGEALGYDRNAVVGRFKFHTPSTGATSCVWQSDRYVPQSDHSGSYDQEFRFAVTTESSGYEGHSGSAGAAVSASGGRLTGTLQQGLLPDTDYYLWVWPATTAYSMVLTGGVGVVLDGVYGTPSTIGAEDGSFGAQIPISLTASGQGAVHTVTVSCAGRTETLLTESSAVSCVWTPDLATYAALLPSSGSASAVITCRTWYGGNDVGSSTRTITVRFAPGSLPPTAASGWASAAPYNSGAAAGLTVYVQGYSRAEVSFDSSKISCQYGATVAGYRIRCGGESVSASPYRTPVLTGTAEIVCTVVDSRGQEAEATLTVTALSYAPPVITDVSVMRCDSQGTPADDGQYVSCKARRIYSSLDGQNSCSLTAAYRLAGGSYGAETALQDSVAAILSGLDADRSYEVRLLATDRLGNSATVTVAVATQVWAMKFRPDGLGVGFGKAPEHAKCIELPADWTIRIGSRVIGENT